LAAVFSPRADWWLRGIVLGALAVLVATVAALYYYASPRFTRVGYAPAQPVPFSHSLHAGRLGIDCRYCHVHVEESPHATVPPSQTCNNCHTLVRTTDPLLSQVRESWDPDPKKADAKVPLPWKRVHRVPDYAYFNHAAHVKAGVDCTQCHGPVTQMDVVRHAEPLTMGWCLECHRHPVATASGVNPPQSCQGCHR
jgi:hypothetical protein